MSYSVFHRRQEIIASGNRNSAAGQPLDSHPRSQLARRRDEHTTNLMKLLQSRSSGTLTKLLVNVKIERSFGPLHIILPKENTVGDLIKAAIEVYVKEKRRPFLAETDARCFDLHYSQFNLECLKAEEKLINLESRNFFMCPKPNNSNTSIIDDNTSSCSDETSTFVYSDDFPFPFTRFMDFLL